MVTPNVKRAADCDEDHIQGLLGETAQNVAEANCAGSGTCFLRATQPLQIWVSYNYLSTINLSLTDFTSKCPALFLLNILLA